jgi:hypothetical protein
MSDDSASDLHAAVGSLVTTELIVARRFVHRVPAHDHVAHISAAFCAPAVPDRTAKPWAEMGGQQAGRELNALVQLAAAHVDHRAGLRHSHLIM